MIAFFLLDNNNLFWQEKQERNLRPIYTNKIIELCRSKEANNSPEGEYIIRLHDKDLIVGVIGFVKDVIFDDNIYYEINKDYRGNGLGFQAVRSFLEYLSLNSVNHVVLHIKKTNTPSIKIAEKTKDIYPVFKMEDYGDSFAYHFDISNKKTKERKKVKAII